MRTLRTPKTYLVQKRWLAVWTLTGIAASQLILLGQSANAEECRMAVAWSSEGQFVRNNKCDYVPVPRLDGADWIRSTLSQKYEYRIDAGFDVTADAIAEHIGRICEIGGQPFAIAQAKAVETTNTRSVFFSCLSNPNEVPQ